jgi:hypothetical protein
VVSHISPKTSEIPDFLCAAPSVTARAAFIKESRMKARETHRAQQEIRGYGAPFEPGHQEVFR